VNGQLQNKTSKITTQHLLDQALKALKADIPVLITGETGTGKDHFAQQLHQKLDVIYLLFRLIAVQYQIICLKQNYLVMKAALSQVLNGKAKKV
jgi:transcriptional regulator of acetoin/glycerol metabolism